MKNASNVQTPRKLERLGGINGLFGEVGLATFGRGRKALTTWGLNFTEADTQKFSGLRFVKSPTSEYYEQIICEQAGLW